MSLATVLVLPLMAVFVVGAIVSLIKAGSTLVRFVEVGCVITIAVAALSGVIGIGGSLWSNTTTFEVALSVHVPDVRLPGLMIQKPSAVIVSTQGLV